jgi:hypothetical protein
MQQRRISPPKSPSLSQQTLAFKETTQAGNDWTWHSLAGATSMARELGECQAK